MTMRKKPTGPLYPPRPMWYGYPIDAMSNYHLDNAIRRAIEERPETRIDPTPLMEEYARRHQGKAVVVEEVVAKALAEHVATAHQMDAARMLPSSYVQAAIAASKESNARFARHCAENARHLLRMSILGDSPTGKDLDEYLTRIIRALGD